jgi:hypothetical protein
MEIYFTDAGIPTWIFCLYLTCPSIPPQETNGGTHDFSFGDSRSLGITLQHALSVAKDAIMDIYNKH